MTAQARTTVEATIPFVAVVSSYPLVAEAVEGALEGIAEVHAFPAGQGDTADFLRLLQPAAVVVDSAEETEAASSSRASRAPRSSRFCFAKTVSACCTPAVGRTSPTAQRHPERIRSAIAAGIYL